MYFGLFWGSFLYHPWNIYKWGAYAKNWVTCFHNLVRRPPQTFIFWACLIWPSDSWQIWQNLGFSYFFSPNRSQNLTKRTRDLNFCSKISKIHVSFGPTINFHRFQSIKIIFKLNKLTLPGWTLVNLHKPYDQLLSELYCIIGIFLWY